jgi:hypothetical protein
MTVAIFDATLHRAMITIQIVPTEGWLKSARIMGWGELD